MSGLFFCGIHKATVGHAAPLGTLLDAPGVPASRAWTHPGRYQTLPGAHIPAKRRVGTPHVAKVVNKFVVFTNLLTLLYFFNSKIGAK